MRRERALQGKHLLTLLFSLTAHFGAKEAGDLSTLFDVGGILGLSTYPGWRGWIRDDLGTVLALTSLGWSPLQATPSLSPERLIQCPQHSAGSKHPSILFWHPFVLMTITASFLRSRLLRHSFPYTLQAWKRPELHGSAEKPSAGRKWKG